MKKIKSHIYDPSSLDQDLKDQDLKELENLLESKDELSESKDLLPFFRDRRNLICCIGACYHPKLIMPDRYAHECDIFGDFRSDFLVGDSSRGAFCFIELEDATKTSIFHQVGKRTSRDWAPRFNHGYSQIIDWSYKIDDMKKTNAFRDKFQSEKFKPLSLLIIGRDKFLSDNPEEKRRLDWRKDNVIVHSMTVACLTYDQLLVDLKDHCTMYYKQAEENFLEEDGSGEEE